MKISKRNPIIHFLQCYIQHYDPERYWRYRDKVMAPTNGKLALAMNYIRLMYVKWCDAYNNASLGTDIGRGARFASIPDLPHGLNGIIINPNCVIGRNAKIFHQVTLGDYGRGEFDAPTIGDNVTIGAGSVVTKDIPDNATAVGNYAKCISFDNPARFINNMWNKN